MNLDAEAQAVPNSKRNGFARLDRPGAKEFSLQTRNPDHKQNASLSPIDILSKRVQRLKENSNGKQNFTDNILGSIMSSYNSMKKELTGYKKGVEAQQVEVTAPKGRGRTGRGRGGFDGRTAVNGKDAVTDLGLEERGGFDGRKAVTGKDAVGDLTFYIDQLCNGSQSHSARIMRQDTIRMSAVCPVVEQEFIDDENDCKFWPVKTPKIKISSDKSIQYFERVEEEDHINVWYTNQEVDSFHTDIRTTMVALAIQNGDVSKLDPLQFALRGLERYLDSSIERRSRKIRNTVLNIQNEYPSAATTANREDGSNTTDANSKSLELSLAETYASCNQDCIQEALLRAPEDAKSATEYLYGPIEETGGKTDDRIFNNSKRTEPVSFNSSIERTSSTDTTNSTSSRNTVTSVASLMAGTISLEFQVSII